MLEWLRRYGVYLDYFRFLDILEILKIWKEEEVDLEILER